MISMETNPFKAITISFSSPISCHHEALSGNMAFPSFCTMGDPPPSPVTPIQTFMSHVSNKPMGDIPNGYYQEKLKLFQQALPTLVLKRILFSYELV